WAVLGGLYLAASLTKEHGLILPGLLLAAEAFLVPGTVRSKVPLLWRGYALLAGVGGALLLLRRAVLGGEIAGTFTAEALQGVGWGGRALTLLQVVPQWLRLLAWPAHLRSDYSPQEFVASSGLGAAELLGLVLLLGAVLLVWLARRQSPALAFGLTWCALALFPVSNLLIPTGVLIAERALFLPSVGFLLAGAGALEWVARGRWAAARPGLVRGAGLAVAALALAGILRSAERHRVWRNEAFLAARSVQDAPRSFRTQRAYASVLFQLGQRELALEAYRRASELAPRGNAWQVRNDLARWFRETGEPGPEAEQLRASLEDRPEQEDIRAYLVAAYLALGSYESAAREADSALARGGNQQVFRGLRSLADSALRSGAPPGTVRIRIGTGPGLPIR
ncbi:MAG TPA: tetratricopeptide repeat protein, partial [Gemmatimonadales bacterium]|nr:tetratricopeptide repeat protein [Gemmatimonadales bacterium]